MDIQFGLFEHLLKSPSKDFLHQILVEAFNQREHAKISENVVKAYSEPLELDTKTAEELLKELGKLIKRLLFESLLELAQIQTVFAASSLPENLKNLLSKLLVEKLAFFKQRLLNEEAILPKLVEFDWRVDIQMNSNLAMSDESGKSGQQTCILQLKEFEQVELNKIWPDTRRIRKDTSPKKQIL